MSLTKDELTELAKTIYVAKVGWLDPKYWDFQPIVQRSFDAAQAFSDVLDAISQQQTQTDQAPPVPVIDPATQQTPASDPAAPAAQPPPITVMPDPTQAQAPAPTDPTAQPQPPPSPTT